jgi:hypothetical protein
MDTSCQEKRRQTRRSPSVPSSWKHKLRLRSERVSLLLPLPLHRKRLHERWQRHTLWLTPVEDRLEDVWRQERQGQRSMTGAVSSASKAMIGFNHEASVDQYFFAGW